MTLTQSPRQAGSSSHSVLIRRNVVPVRSPELIFVNVLSNRKFKAVRENDRGSPSKQSRFRENYLAA